MRQIFWGFCRNWFLIDHLHYFSSRSEFGFEFAEIFVIVKRLPDPASLGVADSAFECLKCLKLLTPQLAVSGSRYGESGSRSNF
jgi:hypothetical protein